MSFFYKNIAWLKEKYPNQSGLFPAEINSDYRPSPSELFQIIETFNIPLKILIKNDFSLIDQLPFDKIKWLVLDVDGTITDGGMYFMGDGNEMKRFDPKNGMGILKLQKIGVQVAFLSHGYNKAIIKRRAEMLGIEAYYCGKTPKIEVMKQWMKVYNFDYSSVAYVGDDINDLDVLEQAAISACPADAADEVREKVDIILHKKSGEACIRELVDDYFLKLK